MEIAQMKDLFGTVITMLFMAIFLVGLVGAYVVGAYKAKLLNDRLEEAIGALKYALVTQRENYEDLAKQKTIVVTRNGNNKELTIQALNTTPEEYARKQQHVSEPMENE